MPAYEFTDIKGSSQKLSSCPPLRISGSIFENKQDFEILKQVQNDKYDVFQLFEQIQDIGIILNPPECLCFLKRPHRLYSNGW